MFDKLMGGLSRRAERKAADNAAGALRDAQQHLRLLARAGRAVITAREDGTDAAEAVEGAVGWGPFLRAVAEAEHLSRPEAVDVRAELVQRWPALRQFAPALLEAFEFEGAASASGLFKAVSLLRGMNRAGRRALPGDAPVGFIRRGWRSFVLGEDGKPNRRAWEVCVLSELRDRLRAGDVVEERAALLTTALADGINLGLTRMAESCRGHSLRQFAWMHDWHVREECYAAALARLIEAHRALPLARAWGDDSTSSSNGQFFRTGGRGEALGDINARHGNEPGVAFYTHVSDQFGPFHTKVIAATASEAPHVLDGLLQYGTGLRIAEHYTDTGGATDQVSGLLALLGFRFAPRLRDLKDRRLYSFRGQAVPDVLAGGTVDSDHVRTHWNEVLRLAVSVGSGHASASGMLCRLAAYPRQNGLAVALREIGRVERSLFALDWLRSGELRRRANAGLNKGEARNALARAVFFHAWASCGTARSRTRRIAPRG